MFDSFQSLPTKRCSLCQEPKQCQEASSICCLLIRTTIHGLSADKPAQEECHLQDVQVEQVFFGGLTFYINRDTTSVDEPLEVKHTH